MTLPAVEPIMGAPFTYWVGSRTDPEKRHRVDWLHQIPNCTCHDWSMKQRAHREQTGEHYLCFHLRFAQQHQWNEILEHTREQLGLPT